MVNSYPMKLVATSLTMGAALFALACGGPSRAELRAAKSSGYATDFALVYSNTLQVVSELYPNLVENASIGEIKTAWHVVRYTTGQGDDGVQQGGASTGDISGSGVMRGSTTRQTRYFIRFTVRVVGGNPWQVRVSGQASEWELGSTPVELRGANEPHWLQGRTDALQVAIHRRLQQYAVPLGAERIEAPVAATEAVPDTSAVNDLPPPVAEVALGVLTAARSRDHARLRTLMADQFTWSFGGDASADAALAMWQADGSVLTKLVEVLEAGCRMDEDDGRATCPPAYTEADEYVGYRAGFARVGADWKMIFFVAGD
jgi:hypothetical protein